MAVTDMGEVYSKGFHFSSPDTGHLCDVFPQKITEL